MKLAAYYSSDAPGLDSQQSSLYSYVSMKPSCRSIQG